MILVDAAGQAHDGAACVGIPVGSAQAGEGGNDIAAVGVFHAGCEIFGIRRLIDDLELIAQPLDGSTGYEDRAFQSVLNLAVETPCDGGQQSVVGIHGLLTDVHQHEAACAVGVFGVAGCVAGLSEQSRLLVARDTRDLDRTAEELGIRLAVDAAGRFCFRKHVLGNFQSLAELIVPLKCVDVEQKCSGCVGIIRHMYFALGQLEDQPGINSTEGQFALLCSLADTGDIVQDPAELGAGEIGVKYKAGFVVCAVGDIRIFRHQLVLHVRGSAALPDDGMVNRLTGLAIPHNNSFSLVCDADRCDVLIGGPDLLHGQTGNRKLCLPDLVSIVLNPAGSREILSEFLLRHAADLSLFVEENAAVAGRTSVECHYILRHKISSFTLSSQ